jgi:hypothetical protein
MPKESIIMGNPLGLNAEALRNIDVKPDHQSLVLSSSINDRIGDILRNTLQLSHKQRVSINREVHRPLSEFPRDIDSSNLLN